jgi:hypothetical protein
MNLFRDNEGQSDVMLNCVVLYSPLFYDIIPYYITSVTLSLLSPFFLISIFTYIPFQSFHIPPHSWPHHQLQNSNLHYVSNH